MLHSGFPFGETQEQAQVNEGLDSLLGCGSIGSLPSMEEALGLTHVLWTQ